MSGAPKVSPLAQNNNNGYSAPQSPQTSPNANVSNVASPPPPPPPPPMGQMAMGMPFQVLPSLPAAKAANQQQKLSPTQTNGSAKKSPQTFESPPMGCRPQIIIPENPMATLRKVPRPQQRDNYWVEEFINESPRHSESEDAIRQQIASSPMFQQQQQRQEYVSTPPLQAKAATPVNVPSTPLYAQSPIPERQEINIPIRNIKLEDVRSPSPTRVYINQQSPQLQATSPIARQMEPTQQQPTKLQQQILNNQPHGGRIILSTMPNRTQATQPNVSKTLV